MPVYIHLANLIIDKAAVKEKYSGGEEQFQLDFSIGGDNYNQEDNELFSIARMNVDEFDIDELVQKGLYYNEELQFSNDFVIRPRYGTYLWKTDWIADNNVFAWHIEASKELVEKAMYIGNNTIEEIKKLYERGERPFDTIK